MFFLIPMKKKIEKNILLIITKKIKDFAYSNFIVIKNNYVKT